MSMHTTGNSRSSRHTARPFLPLCRAQNKADELLANLKSSTENASRLTDNLKKAADAWTSTNPGENAKGGAKGGQKGGATTVVLTVSG